MYIYSSTGNGFMILADRADKLTVIGNTFMIAGIVLFLGEAITYFGLKANSGMLLVLSYVAISAGSGFWAFACVRTIREYLHRDEFYGRRRVKLIGCVVFWSLGCFLFSARAISIFGSF